MDFFAKSTVVREFLQFSIYLYIFLMFFWHFEHISNFFC